MLCQNCGKLVEELNIKEGMIDVCNECLEEYKKALEQFQKSTKQG